MGIKKLPLHIGLLQRINIQQLRRGQLFNFFFYPISYMIKFITAQIEFLIPKKKSLLKNPGGLF